MFANLREYIDSVCRRDPAARSALEVLTAYPGIHALGLHRVSHRLWTWGLKWLARMLSQLSRLLTGIEIHPAARIGRGLFIDHGMGVVIGETAEIGDDCTLYHGVTLGGTTWRREKRHPTLGKNVVVGAGAKILGPIVVGDGARIGSNSVVTKDVPPGATIIGIPGHIVAPKSQGDARARLGFDAYGQPQQLPDPVAHAIDCVLEHLHVVDKNLKSLRQALEMQGIKIDIDFPEIEISTLENSGSGAKADQSDGNNS